MRTGDLVAGRFLVEREAGVGGMGRVYRARENATGRTVALKVLHGTADASSRERFDREAAILSSLSHPAIVGYVAHGAHEGSPFLAMEWLEGEPLSARLRRGPLALSDAVELGVHVAEALACAHEAGVLHRDVKPGNLILGSSDADVRVVDFGVARHARETRAVTRTGMIVGSCSFMSPEQALGQRDIDARSDLFSLGCVLYECIGGVRAFGARDATAALAKVLLEEPAPLHQIAKTAPRALTELVAWLLKKDRAQRPSTAGLVAERLRAAGANLSAVPAELVSSPALGTRERRVIWVVLASNALGTSPSSETMPDDAPTIADDEEGTGQLRAIVKQFGGTLAFLADATAIATFTGGVPTDEAPRAARCALAMREALPASPIAIAMGRGDLLPTERGVPIGEVIDDAADALQMTPPGAIRLRGVDPSWLSGFEIAKDDHGVRVVRRAEVDFVPRTLLGRPTSCVGRDRELSMLEGLYDDCANEPQAKVALVTAAAGTGKSRVRHELLARLARRDDPPHVVVARCDAMSAGAPFAAIADALRREARIVSTDDEAAQRAKIVALARGDAAQAPLLGELAGVPFPDDASEALHAARRDAFLMGDLVRAAFESWLASIDRPVVLVVEDLHWGDVPSVRVLDSALRNLSSRPLFVLALARPEVNELFPSLWADRGVVSIALAPLSKRAAEKLARETLGERASDAAIASIVERAQGNAFFLEELVRGTARGDATLPNSIFGMIQTRLDALTAETRQVLRAASVFGDAFTADGAFALLGDTASRARLEEQLGELARAEIVTSSEGGAYRFRHALVRDATYATLTDDDRKLGHRLAAEHLESMGGAPLALAEHFVRGGVPERAIAHLRASAIKALEGNDLTGAVALVERALALSPSREDLGVLHATAAEASRWMGAYDHAARHGIAALEALQRGSVRWFLALGEYIATCSYRRDFEAAAPKVADARATPAQGKDAINARLVCLARGGTQLLEGGLLDQADAVIREIASETPEKVDDNSRGWMNWLLAMRSLHAGDLASFARNTEACLAAFERIGEVRNTSSQRINLGYAYAELGAFERAEALFRRVQRDAEAVGLPMVVAYALQNLGNVLRALGRLEEAREQERRATVIGAAIGDRRIEGAARAYAALMSVELGDHATAEEDCRRALTALEKNPPLVGFAKSVLARALVAQNRAAEALVESRDALAILGDSVEDGETFIRLTHIETLEAVGDLDAARALAIESEARLRARGDRILDDALRKSFFERVPESSRTLAVAARLRGMPAPEKA